jgi:hypothetical protein
MKVEILPCGNVIRYSFTKHNHDDILMEILLLKAISRYNHLLPERDKMEVIERLQDAHQRAVLLGLI